MFLVTGLANVRAESGAKSIVNLVAKACTGITSVVAFTWIGDNSLDVGLIPITNPQPSLTTVKVIRCVCALTAACFSAAALIYGGAYLVTAAVGLYTLSLCGALYAYSKAQNRLSVSNAAAPASVN